MGHLVMKHVQQAAMRFLFPPQELINWIDVPGGKFHRKLVKSKAEEGCVKQQKRLNF